VAEFAKGYGFLVLGLEGTKICNFHFVEGSLGTLITNLIHETPKYPRPSCLVACKICRVQVPDTCVVNCTKNTGQQEIAIEAVVYLLAVAFTLHQPDRILHALSTDIIVTHSNDLFTPTALPTRYYLSW
jgi:hypothetical protein